MAYLAKYANLTYGPHRATLASMAPMVTNVDQKSDRSDVPSVRTKPLRTELMAFELDKNIGH